MKQYLIGLALSQLSTLADFFEMQDEDNEGRDDRIARILRTAYSEIVQYRKEIGKPKV